MACQICKSKKSSSSLHIRDYEYNYKRTVEYKTCNDCSLIYRNKISKEAIKKLYEINYAPSYGGFLYDFLKKINAFYEWKKIQYISKTQFKQKEKKLKFLDIGCGKGYLLNKIATNKLYKCIGIDINQDNEKKKFNLKFYKTSYDDFKLIKKINPNFIILNNFIEHIENLHEFKKLLGIINKKSGLIIITPDGASKSKKTFGNFWSGYHSPRHVNIFNKKNFEAFLNSNNLSYKIISIIDPLASLSSFKNCIVDIKKDFTVKKFLSLFRHFIFTLLDFKVKSRLLVICFKK